MSHLRVGDTLYSKLFMSIHIKTLIFLIFAAGGKVHGDKHSVSWVFLADLDGTFSDLDGLSLIDVNRPLEIGSHASCK